MKRTAMVLVATTLVAAAMGVSRDALALGPVDLEVGAKVGAGTNPFSGPNPLGLGLGARAGVSFIGLYGGRSFMYYLGSSQDLPNGGGHVSENAVQYGVEGGYSTGLGPFTLRGQLGVGNIQFNLSGALSANAGHLYLEPGALLMLSLGTIFVGADANVLVLPDVPDPVTGNSSWQAAFTADGQIGLKF